MRSAIARVRARLVEYGLVESQSSAATILRLVKQGNQLLAGRQMERWRTRPAGRPKRARSHPVDGHHSGRADIAAWATQVNVFVQHATDSTVGLSRIRRHRS
jgi:hypothetical protein